MRNDTTRQSVVFKDLFGKPVVARFDQPDSSSDGGAVLLKACDERLGLTDALARCLPDGRQQSKVAHSFHDLVRQRVFGIACGYEDCNDAARVGDDPIHKLWSGATRWRERRSPRSRRCRGLRTRWDRSR